LSLVKLRKLVVINRTKRSKTISSIGKRSYETSAELMIARTPVLPARVIFAEAEAQAGYRSHPD
jgi:hypothetical protein